MAVTAGAIGACTAVNATDRSHAPGPAPVADIGAPSSATAATSGSAAHVDEPAPTAPHASASGSSSASAHAPIAKAPPHTLIDGAAAILWVPNAAGALESVLIDNVAGSAHELARRPGIVMVSKTDLWVQATRPVLSAACAPCGGPAKPPQRVDEPVLRSLTTGRTIEPWKAQYAVGQKCDPDLAENEVSVSIFGAVGPIVFGVVSASYMGCVAAHPGYNSEPLAFDLDGGGGLVPLTFPKQIVEPLRERAHAELLAGGCVMDETEAAKEYRATAEYDATGELEGVYDYIMSAPYVCGLGPDHYSNVSEQRSDWLPSALAPYGKLPAWVAAALGQAKGKHAFMIAADRLAAATADFGKK